MLKKLFFLAVFWACSWGAAATSCSTAQPESFDRFFQRFAGDRVYAVERTILPLQMWRWEYGVDEKGKDDSAPKKSLLARKDYLEWSSLNDHMKSNGLEAKVKLHTTAAVVVEVFKPDTDWLVSWHFKTKAGCWYFWRHEDHSL